MEASLDRKREAQLPHCCRGPGREELGLELLGEDAFHLQGHAWEHEDPLAIRLVETPGRHAASILEHMRRARGNARHAQVAFRDVGRFEQPHRVHPLHAPLDARTGLLPDHQLLAQRSGERGEGAVVGRRPESAADEHVRDLRVVELAAQLLDDLLRPVTDLGRAFDRVTEHAEPFRHPVGVRVEGEASDQLVPDRHDAGCGHG